MDASRVILPGTAVAVSGHPGNAFQVIGPELVADEDTVWSGYKVPTGRVLVRMIGDDHDYKVDPEDLSEIDDESYCPGCGAIGCGHA